MLTIKLNENTNSGMLYAIAYCEDPDIYSEDFWGWDTESDVGYELMEFGSLIQDADVFDSLEAAEDRADDVLSSIFEDEVFIVGLDPYTPHNLTGFVKKITRDSINESKSINEDTKISRDEMIDALWYAPYRSKLYRDIDTTFEPTLCKYLNCIADELSFDNFDDFSDAMAKLSDSELMNCYNDYVSHVLSYLNMNNIPILTDDDITLLDGIGVSVGSYNFYDAEDAINTIDNVYFNNQDNKNYRIALNRIIRDCGANGYPVDGEFYEETNWDYERALELIDVLNYINNKQVNESKSINEDVNYDDEEQYAYVVHFDEDGQNMDKWFYADEKEKAIKYAKENLIDGPVLYEIDEDGIENAIDYFFDDEIDESKSIKESSDSGYWYFTRHGVQPGSIPKGANVLTIQDVENGTYVKLDRVLTTKELNDYEIIEKRPEGLDESKSINEGHQVQTYKGYELDWNEDGIDPEEGTANFDVYITKDGKTITNNAFNGFRAAREYIDRLRDNCWDYIWNVTQSDATNDEYIDSNNYEDAVADLIADIIGLPNGSYIGDFNDSCLQTSEQVEKLPEIYKAVKQFAKNHNIKVSTNESKSIKESTTGDYVEVAYICDGFTNFRVYGGGFKTSDALVAVEDEKGKRLRLTMGDVREFYTWYDAKGNVIHEPTYYSED